MKLSRTLLKNPYLWLAWLFIIVVAIAPRVIDLGVFYARDELAIWPWVDEFAAAIRRGHLAGTLTGSDYPGIPMFWLQTLFLGVKYSFPFLFRETMLPFDLISTDRSLALLAERRLVVGLFIGLQIIAAAGLVRRLLGWPIALLSAVLMGLDPFGLTEARLLRLEMISAYFVCLALLAYLLYLGERRRRWLLLSGVMAGLGVSSKTSAGLMVPFIWLLLLADFLFDLTPSVPGQGRAWLAKFKRMIGDGLLWAGGAVGAFWLIWPAMWVKPLAAIEYVFLTGYFQAANRSVWGEEVFFWGRVIEGGDPGPFFYPVALAFRTTPLAWIGLAGALLFIGVSLWPRLKSKSRNGPAAPIAAAWPAVVSLLLLVYILLLVVELSLIISKVDRFLLIVFPAINILSAIGLVVLLNWLVDYALRLGGQKGPARARVWLPAGGLALILAAQLALTLPAHPYYFTYWNPWMGGGRAAMKTVPVGAGEGIDLAMDYLNGQPGASDLSVVCGASHPWCQRKFTGQTLRSSAYFSGEWVTADYASLYISHLQRQKYPPEIVEFFGQQQPRYRVDLQGATYATLYDVPPMAHFAGTWNVLDGLGQLLGYNLVWSRPAATSARVGETVQATFWWVNAGAGVDNLVLRWVDETGYEWGRAGIVPWPEYASLAPDKRAIAAGTAVLPIPPGTPPGTYFLRLGVVEPGSERPLGHFRLPDEANRLVVAPGQIVTEPEQVEIPRPVHRPLAPEITLLGYAPPAQLLSAHSPTWLTLYWQAMAPPPDYVVLLRLLEAGGREMARWQHRPGHDHYPTEIWQTGQIVRDVWALQVAPEIPVGRYSLAVSLHRPDEPELQRPAGSPPASLTGPLFVIENVEVWPQPVQYDAPDMQAELGANFGNRLTLLGYDLYFDTDGAGAGRLSPHFYWQSQADMQAAFDLRLTLRAADTGQVKKEWRLPLGVEGARTLWKANEIINTGYRLDTGVLDQGRYHLDIALQSRADGSEIGLAVIENIQDKVVVRLIE